MVARRLREEWRTKIRVEGKTLSSSHPWKDKGKEETLRAEVALDRVLLYASGV